jgi:2-polyprenyl-6-methoxyphenol hydroxylase-like FAD-dependent oxidoreductase
MLHKYVSTLPTIEVRYRTTLESFRQNDEKVVADIVDATNGQRSSIEACYLIGCDGVRSTVRRQLGIQFEGVFAEGMNVAVLFRSPLLSLTPHGPLCSTKFSTRKSREPLPQSMVKNCGD